jgi:hypothetical protein
MNQKNSQDLFNKIRSQFSNIRLGDADGAATADPQDAVFFEFEFREDADTFGSVSISLADGENMKVFYNRDLVEKIDEDSRDEWYAFLKELKDFAVEHQLRFDVRDITKSNLTKQDYQNLADTNKTVNTDEMSEELKRITKLAGIEVKESLTGTAKRSYENLDKTRLIIRHSGKVDETVPGARSRQIQSLYIENEDGERFKYPITHLAGARAMQRHVANGGRPHDEFGEHIVKTSEDIAKLNSFSRYVSNKDQLNDNAGDIIEQTKLKLENLREYMRNLSKQKHYEAHCKSFRKAEDQILDDETVAKLREKFTMKNLDNRVEDALPLINRIMSELEAPKEEVVQEKDKPFASPLTHDERISPKIKSQGMRDFLDVIIDKYEPDAYKQEEDSAKILYNYNDQTGNKLSREQIDKLTNLIGDGGIGDDEDWEKKLIKAGVDLEKLGQVAKQYQNNPYESEEGDRIKKAMKDMVPSTVTGYYEITEFWKEHTQGMGKTDDEVMHEIYEWTWDEMGVSDTKERDEVAKRTSVIVDDVIKNNKDDMTFDDMIDQLKGKKEDQVNELDDTEGPKIKDTQPTVIGKDVEPIKADPEPQVDHGAVVQSFLTDPEAKLVLRKDPSADKMLKATKFKDKSTMLGAILSDIASRMLTKTGEEDRVANFASRVADGIDQEGSTSFKPGPDYNKNKKIAVQLAKRYIDDYKKMQSDPEYGKEVRMDPAEFNPKKKRSGGVHSETEAFEGWVDSIGEATIKPYVSMYRGDDGKMIYDVLDKDSNSAFKSGDYDAAREYLSKNYDKLREYAKMGKFPRDPEIAKKDKENATKLAVTQMDKEMGTPAFKRMQSGDPRYVDKTKKEEMTDKEVDKFHTELDKVVHKHIGHSSDEKKEKEDMKKEGNEFALAVRKAKAAGMKAGDKFKVGDQEYTLKDAIELAGLQLEEFFSEEEIAYDNQIDRIKNLAFYQ